MEEIEPGFCQSNGYPEPEPVDNAAARWGSAFENAIIDVAEEKTGYMIDLKEFEFINPVHDFLTCHVDGVYIDMKPRVIHEGKTTTDYTFRDSWGEPESDRVPREIQLQVQHQMLCSQIDEAIVSVLVWPRRTEDFEAAGMFPNLETCKKSDLERKQVVDPLEWIEVLKEMDYFHQYRLKADYDLHELMIEKYVDFWETNIVGRTPPDPVSYDDIRKLVREPKGTIVATEEIERLSSEYKLINEELSNADKRKDQLKTELLKYMSEAAEAPIDDDSVEKWILRDRQGHKLNQYNGKTFR